MATWEDYQAHLDRRALAVVQEDALLHLAGFVRDAWHVLEPGAELCWAPYLDVLCRECEAVYRGEVRDLTVCIPPGLMKSLLISVLLPAWWWLHDPCERFLCVSHDDDLARRDSRRMRDVILSDYYQALIERQAGLGRVKRWELKHGHNQLDNYGTTAQGFRQCLSIGGAITGKRGNVVLLDDPHDVRDVVLGSHEQVRRRLSDTAHVVEQVLPTRVNDRRTARWITIQQRLHDEDTAARRIRRGQTRPVVLPMHYDAAHPDAYEHDPRTEPDELLHPVFMPELEVAALVEQLGDQAPGQLEQRPIAAVGGLYRPEHFSHRYEKRPEWLRRQQARCVVSVDATFKGRRPDGLRSDGGLGADGPPGSRCSTWSGLGWTTRPPGRRCATSPRDGRRRRSSSRRRRTGPR